MRLPPLSANLLAPKVLRRSVDCLVIINDVQTQRWRTLQGYSPEFFTLAVQSRWEPNNAPTLCAYQPRRALLILAEMPPPPTGFNVSHQRQAMGGGGSSGSHSPPLGSGWQGAMMAASGSGWMGASPVDILVHRACDPSLSEPPYQVHVELAELINKKKANTYV